MTGRLKSLWAAFEGMSRNSALLLAGGLLLGAATVDWVTGPEIAISIIYLIPITLVTWKAGRWLGIGVALICGFAWFGVELVSNTSYSSLLILIWNALVRAGFFSLVSWLTAEVIERKRIERSLRQIQESLEQRVRERTSELQVLNSTLERRVFERSAAAEERAQKLALSQADLEKQTGILQSILDSMGDGVIVADSSGKLMLMNPAAFRILSLDNQMSNELLWTEVCKTFSDPASERLSLEGCLQRTISGHSFDGLEVLIRHRSRPAGIWLSVTGRPMLNENGTAAGGVIVFGDITARKELERQIADVSDREQRRIGQDLHDGLCQHLVSTAFAARNLTAKLFDRGLSECDDAAKIAELLSQSVSQARDVARGLHPVQLEAGGLGSALEDLAVRTRARYRIACNFIDETSEPVLNESLVTNLFRIAQEAVTNAVKHANPRHITIRLSANEQELWLRVEDDGTGVQSGPAETGGMGVPIMNYRARMIDANFQIDSQAGRGTTVSCVVARPADVRDSNGCQSQES